MGDGDFLMTCQELSTAVQYNIPVVYCVLNNFGWLSIRDLQLHYYGKDRQIATEFRRETTKELYNPDFVIMARSFGAYGEKVENAKDVKLSLKRAFESRQPALLEIITATQFPRSEGALAGWSDFPVPKYIRR
jgi:acetolactate synthase-1/2/3 large subunit